MPDQHALLSASGAHRWLNCPPSARLEADQPDQSSVAAEQGTVAHALAEFKLRRALHEAPGFRPDSRLIDEEMERHTDDYVTYVLEELKEARKDCVGARVLVEQRLDFSHVVPGGFGTGDCAIIAEPKLIVIDFKYGAGVLVEAEGNPQLRLYALGALGAFGDLYDIDEVEAVIYQPRRDNITTTELTVAELEAWANEVVKPQATLAAEGSGEFQAGSWCQFCKISATCRARAQANLKLAQHEFAPPAQLSDTEIAEVLSQIPQLKAWAADVEAHALALAVNQGKTWPGFKLVEGRSIRKYASETQVAQAAEAAGVTDVWEQRLKTITALEKQLGKKTFNDLLGAFVVKPPGKPTLVPESDKRPALAAASASSDFTPLKNTKKNKS